MCRTKIDELRQRLAAKLSDSDDDDDSNDDDYDLDDVDDDFVLSCDAKR